MAEQIAQALTYMEQPWSSNDSQGCEAFEHTSQLNFCIILVC